jgi:hypothetical protein
LYQFTRRVKKVDCSNYRGITLLSTSYKIVSNILLSRLSPYVDKIIGDHQCRFRPNRSTTDQIFCIHQIYIIYISIHFYVLWLITWINTNSYQMYITEILDRALFLIFINLQLICHYIRKVHIIWVLNYSIVFLYS